MQKKNDLPQLIEKEYNKLFNTSETDYRKAAFLSNIIQLKREFKPLYKRPLSQDIKEYIHCIITASSKEKIGYDHVPLDRIIQTISDEPLNLQPDYYEFLQRELDKACFKDLLKKVVTQKYKVLIQLSFKSHNPLSIAYHLIKYTPLLSATNILLTLLVLACLFLLTLSQAPFNWLKILEIPTNPIQIHPNSSLNHFLNGALYLTGFNSKFLSTPTNLISTLYLIVVKIFTFIYITIIFSQKLNDYLKYK